METLQWAREQGCPWHELTVEWAIQNTQLETLKWVIEHGCEWDKDGAMDTARQAVAMHDKTWAEHDLTHDERFASNVAVARERCVEMLRYVLSLVDDDVTSRAWLQARLALDRAG
jgi:hypothetical protein